MLSDREKILIKHVVKDLGEFHDRLRERGCWMRNDLGTKLSRQFGFNKEGKLQLIDPLATTDNPEEGITSKFEFIKLVFLPTYKLATGYEGDDSSFERMILIEIGKAWIRRWWGG